MPLHLVIGPPAAGKTTYVQQHMQPGDIIIDYDAIANALAGTTPDNHDHTDTAKKVTKAARDAAIREAQKHAQDVDVWLIHAMPAQSTIDRHRNEGAHIIVVDPGKDTVMRRIKHQRPTHMHAIAAKWYEQADEPKPKPKSTTERGYGHKHQQTRKRLMYNHIDGTPCDWCGKPMHKDPKKNFDGAALEADHEHSLKLNGPSNANRLRHKHCNAQAREGGPQREHLRPTNNPPQPNKTNKTTTGTTIGWDWL